MKVLIVSAGDEENQVAPFVDLQVKNLKKIDVECILFLINKKGLAGYLSLLPKYWKVIRETNPDVVHAHYSLSGLFALFQFRKKVIISYIGSDLMLKKLKLLSYFTMLFTKYSIFVSEPLINSVPFKFKNFRVIRYGIDLEHFNVVDKQLARKKLGFDSDQIYCLFPALKDRPVKNYALAEKCIDKAAGIKTITIGHNLPIQELNLIYNACDFMLLTSFYEGGPQVVFEALATNLPTVSTDVGIVKESIKDVEGCYICSYEVDDVVSKIKNAVQFNKRTEGRKRLSELNVDSLASAKAVLELYELSSRKKIAHRILKKENLGAGKKREGAFQGKVCKEGVWDESIPGIKFDETGISNYAKIQKNLMADFPTGAAGEAKWKSIVTTIKKTGQGKNYDCIIGVSGGTDSSYLLHLAKENGLNPLAVHLDNGFNSEIAVNNIHKLTKALNVDLKTHVVIYEEMKDILRSYMKAGLPWIDNPTDQAIFNVLYKIANKENIKYVLIGDDFRSEGKQPTEWTYSDQKQLNYIHKKYGKVKLKTYPRLSFFGRYWLALVKKINIISPFYYLDYNKQSAQKLLIDKYKWEYYGEHHHENLFTKWAISYWMFEKFGFDKRKITYSAQILNNKITRDEVVKLINKIPYDKEKIDEEISYVLKKLDISKEEFDKIWNSPNRSFNDYPSNYKTIYKYARFLKPILGLVLTSKPKIFYEMEERNK